MKTELIITAVFCLVIIVGSIIVCPRLGSSRQGSFLARLDTFLRIVSFLSVFIFVGIVGYLIESQNEPSYKLREDNCPLKGFHSLRKIKSSSQIDGFFILGTGGINQEMVTNFAWDTGLGYYKVSSISLSKVKFVITNTSTPYIKFNIIGRCRDGLDSFDSITVFCKDSDFPQQIDTSL